MPMLTFKLSKDQPCLDPSLLSTISDYASQIEIQKQASICWKQDNNFRRLNATISLYDLHNQNGVQAVLENHPHYTYFAFPGPSAKKNMILQTYARPSIPWKLSCDQSKMSRQEIFELSSRGIMSSEPMEQGLLWASLFVLISLACPTKDIIINVFIMTVGSITAGALSVKPFVRYV